MSAQFDAFAATYEALHDRNVALVGAESQEFVHDKLRWCARLSAQSFGGTTHPKTFLDYGCGVGRLGFEFRGYFDGSWSYVGVDPSSESIREARRQHSAARESVGTVTFHALESWRHGPHYDFILAACVFHHIEPEQRAGVLQTLWKALRPAGIVAVWEHNPWNPITRRLVAECEFDQGVRLLSAPEMSRLWRVATGDAAARHRFVTFFPGAMRKLKPIEPALGWLPIGGQWVFWGKKPSIATQQTPEV